MLWKYPLIVLAVATVAGGTLVSAVNLTRVYVIHSSGAISHPPTHNVSVTIQCYGTINYDPRNLEEDVNDVWKDCARMDVLEPSTNSSRIPCPLSLKATSSILTSVEFN